MLKHNKSIKQLYRIIPKLKPLIRFMNNNFTDVAKFPIKGPLLSNNPTLIGHAYDNFFQLYCQRLNYSLQQVSESLDIDETLDLSVDFQMDTLLNHGLYVRGYKAWDSDMTEQSIVYGKIDQAYRSGLNIDDLFTIQDDDFQDMDSLIKITNDTTHSFIGETRFVSRPTFGPEISYLVGGADADLIIDQTLIDIKVYSSLSYESYPWHQLLTYYFLGQLTPGYTNHISRLAIWNPRYDVMMYIEIQDVRELLNFDTFVGEFIRTLELIHLERGKDPMAIRYLETIQNWWK